MKRLLFASVILLAVSCGGSQDADDVEPVTLFGPYRQADADLLATALDQWSHETGIPVRYTGSADFVNDLESQVYDYASPPDIAFVPQPGLVERLLETEALPALPADFVDEIRPRFDPEALRLADFDGVFGGFPFRMNVKSLVWYRPDQFAQRGLAVPDTLDQLDAIVDEYSGTETFPWCLGFESQTATGWPATDWVEDLVAREWGPDTYRNWVEGKVEFSDDRILSSFESFQHQTFGVGRTYGGRAAMLSTNTADAADPLFFEPPGCLMFKQASFASSWMPDGTTFGEAADVHFFVLPDKIGDDPPIVAGVDLAIAFDHRPEVLDLMRFLATPDAVQPWAAAGSFVSPLVEFDSADYSASDLAAAELLLAAPDVLVDGSDAMPVDYGSTLFWSEITEWISGAQSLDQLTATMDAERPATKSD